MRKLGNITFDNPFMLAPMAGITNSAFRTICKEMGASLVVSEMISDKGLIYNNVNTTKLLKFEPMEHPISIQLFGSEKETISKAYDLIKDLDFDILDINMGCPVKKVVNSGAGSALLKNPEKIGEIIKELKAKINRPLTIKIRSGWDNQSITVQEVVKVAENAGADAVIIHPRTRAQLYRGLADREIINKIREVSNIFLIGSGDIKTIDDAFDYLNRGCDAVMIGRAALGNPWIFKKLIAEYHHLEYIEPTPKEIIDVLLLHAKRLIELNGEKSAIVEMRTHAVWYFKKLKNSKQYRLRLVNINTYDELLNICNEYLQQANI